MNLTDKAAYIYIVLETLKKGGYGTKIQLFHLTGIYFLLCIAHA